MSKDMLMYIPQCKYYNIRTLILKGSRKNLKDRFLGKLYTAANFL